MIDKKKKEEKRPGFFEWANSLSDEEFRILSQDPFVILTEYCQRFNLSQIEGLARIYKEGMEMGVW